MPSRYPREQMHRIKYTKLTSEQILGKLVEMARQQGSGVISRAEPVVLEGVYGRGEGGRKILRVEVVRA